MRTITFRLSFIAVAILTAMVLAIGQAGAVTIEQCTSGGGIVIRCAVPTAGTMSQCGAGSRAA
ncbi:hypothetical protein ACQPZ2_29565 [Nocardia pseudovaccinii]|uniref:hypothetical protein n=1 Tax=Nocardia pseudovaccinii TaxID=189540 RepID=UPI003D940DD6